MKFIVHWNSMAKKPDVVEANEAVVTGNAVTFTKGGIVIAIYNLSEIKKVVTED